MRASFVAALASSVWLAGCGCPEKELFLGDDTVAGVCDVVEHKIVVAFDGPVELATFESLLAPVEAEPACDYSLEDSPQCFVVRLPLDISCTDALSYFRELDNPPAPLSAHMPELEQDCSCGSFRGAASGDPGPEEPGVIDGQLVVVFVDGLGRHEVDAINDEIGAQVVRAPLLSQAYRVELPPCVDNEEAFDYYVGLPEVQGVQPAIVFGALAAAGTAEVPRRRTCHSRSD